MNLVLESGFSKYIIDNQDEFIIKNFKDKIIFKVPIEKITILHFKTGTFSNKPIVLVVEGHNKAIQIPCNYGKKREHEKLFNYMNKKSNFLNFSYSKAINYKPYTSYRDFMEARENLKKEGCIFKEGMVDKLAKVKKKSKLGNFSYIKKHKDMSFKNFIKLNSKNISEPGIVDHAYNEVLNIIFKEFKLYSKLENFIINNTRKYDNGEMNEREYEKQIELFMYYLSKMNITTEKLEEIENPVTRDKLRGYGKELYGSVNLEESRLRKFIELEKEEVYEKDLREKLNLDSIIISQSEIINRFIEYYGDKSMDPRNIMTLSKTLNKEVGDLKIIVEGRYKSLLEEKELRDLENNLFGSDLNNQFYTIEYIDSLDGFEFEDYLDGLFKSYGYTCEELPYTNDYGADLIISKGGDRIVIQAKNYSGNVGNKAVQEVISAKSYYKCEVAMVITNSQFTRNAIEMAKNTDVILIDRFKLINILNNGALYFTSMVV